MFSVNFDEVRANARASKNEKHSHLSFVRMFSAISNAYHRAMHWHLAFLAAKLLKPPNCEPFKGIKPMGVFLFKPFSSQFRSVFFIFTVAVAV